MTIKDALQAYANGLTNETDESYQGGFWDLAGELGQIDDGTERQEAIYEALTELQRSLK
jgi:hypothetical protein